MLFARLARSTRARPAWARALTTAAPAAGAAPPAPGQAATRSMNMCTAVNEALAIVMETDPK